MAAASGLLYVETVVVHASRLGVVRISRLPLLWLWGRAGCDVCWASADRHNHPCTDRHRQCLITWGAVQVRKPYTITKQRERWTDAEHALFLEALREHGRAWRRIEGTMDDDVADMYHRVLVPRGATGSAWKSENVILAHCRAHRYQDGRPDPQPRAEVFCQTRARAGQRQQVDRCVKFASQLGVPLLCQGAPAMDSACVASKHKLATSIAEWLPSLCTQSCHRI